MSEVRSWSSIQLTRVSMNSSLIQRGAGGGVWEHLLHQCVYLRIDRGGEWSVTKRMHSTYKLFGTSSERFTL